MYDSTQSVWFSTLQGQYSVLKKKVLNDNHKNLIYSFQAKTMGRRTKPIQMEGFYIININVERLPKLRSRYNFKNSYFFNTSLCWKVFS